MTRNSDEPSLDDLARAFPRWEAWRGISQLYYARLRGSSPPIVVRGEDPLDLECEIRRAIARLHDRRG